MLKNNDLFNENQETFTAIKAKSFVVTPSLPESLKDLATISENMRWCWNSDAVELFRRLDRDVWEESYHSPKAMLGLVKQARLEELADDTSFISHMKLVKAELDKYMSVPTWFDKTFPEYKDKKIAYFSTEFAIHESLPIYSGGLGVLSGDHLKSASDMGLPLVGIGLLYRNGYFKQHLSIDGWQIEEYKVNHFYSMPMQLLTDENGNTLSIEISLPHSPRVFARIWKIQVGRVALYLLDTDFDKNSAEDRTITGELYGGDKEMRIKQEKLLGVGGMKVLELLNIDPSVIHINEGHSAFLLLEKMRMLMKNKGLSFEQAQKVVKANCVFTTHTPVPAGNEVFSSQLVSTYFESLYRELGLSKEQFLALGRDLKAENIDKDFSMTILALKACGKANGVSRLHATVSREMWQNVWPELPRKEIPITHITNGIHTNTWISYEFAGLFQRYIGDDWIDEPSDQTLWQRVADIPDAELWRSHERRKERLVSFARNRLKMQLERRGLSKHMVAYADEVLDPEALTIGFARRFATYKRGNLIFRNLDRIKKILTNKEKPVQIIIAGKAHPKDDKGKEIIKSIIALTSDPDLKYKVVFLEDYDMNVAHYLVQGVDIWLNNPLRPQEASGTSGMKAAVNGAINFSVLDGWWCEGYNGENGWVVGSTDTYNDLEYQNEMESRSIYEMLEKEIIPLFFDRGQDDLPRGWITKMKACMQTVGPMFNTNRMIEDYTRKFYVPSMELTEKMKENNYELAKKKADWQSNIERNWNRVSIISADDNTGSKTIKIGEPLKIRVRVNLAGIAPEDVFVQVYEGYLNTKNVLSDETFENMKMVSKEQDGTYIYEIEAPTRMVGHCGYTVRIVPQYMDKVEYIPGIIKWF
ncbi:MAG: alpha-glucan family phosphorylase [Elusimicrobia bacterium]|nr:alpha-glucan family phosphorylase [Elusimicrobiota bacterium]